jgi:hypothetical protein
VHRQPISTIRALISGSSCGLVLLLLLGGDPQAQAGSIIVNNATYCTTMYTCVAVTSLNFSVSGLNQSNQNKGSNALFGPGSSVLHFTNMSGVNWSKLILTETGMPAGSVICFSNLFSCNVTPNGSNGALIVLTAIGAGQGIAAGQSFEIGCNGACPPQISIIANPSAASEPGGLPILLVGLAAMLGWALLSRTSWSHRWRRAS